MILHFPDHPGKRASAGRLVHPINSGCLRRSRMMEVEMKRVTVLVIFALTLCCLPAQPAPAQPTTLHVGFNGFYGAAPLYVAQDAGIFRKHGFKLEMVFIAGGSLSTQALIGKSLDLLQTGGPPFLNAYVRGARLKETLAKRQMSRAFAFGR
jgi:ABC-type nitrate/sulfonate/bicarbonate transport system substrate-binding protein